MAKDDEQVEETAVEEVTTEQGSEVELDKPTNIEGDLVENPSLEVEDEAEAESEESDTSDGESDISEPDADAVDEPETPESAPELESEKDETGVYAPPAPDPGEFQPKGDYGFEITVANGKTVKINTPEEADRFAERLDSEDSLLTPRQFVEFSRNVAKMDRGVERELADFETQKETFEIHQRQEQVRNEQVSQWNNEINYLAAKGLVSEITPQLNASNWTDPKIADQAPVKERLAIFQWMEKENNDRRSAGIAEVTSAVDAFRLMQAEQQEQGAQEEKETETASRQAKGRMVSGNSSFMPENTQKDSIVGEGGNLRDLELEFSRSQ